MRRAMLTCLPPNCLFTVIAAAAWLTAVTPAAHANLVQNGGFETGDFTNWTVSGNVAIGSVPVYGSAGSTAANGNYVAVFNAGDRPANATLSQTVTTAIGTDYSVSFGYSSFNNGGYQSITVAAEDAGGTTLNSFFDTATSATPLATSTFTFRADRNATTIFIADFASNYTLSNDGFLDNVSVSAVPEPFSLTLLATGLIGTSLICRRKTG